MIFEGLVKREAAGEIQPWLVENYTSDPRGHGITFNLRNNVRWHDGQRLSAEDIEFSYRVISHPETISPYKNMFDFIESVTSQPKDNIISFSFNHAIDRPERYFEIFPVLPSHIYATLQPDDDGNFETRFKSIELRETPSQKAPGKIKLPYKAVVQILAEENGWIKVNVIKKGPVNTTGWIPKHLEILKPSRLDKDAGAITLYNKLVGTGPFKFVEKHPNEDIYLERNKDYHHRTAYLDSIRRIHTNDPETMVKLLKQNMLDLLCEVPFERISEISEPWIRKIQMMSLSFTSIVFNTKNSFLKQATNRKAMTMGFDRWAVLLNYYGENQKVLPGPCSPLSWCYNPDMEPLPFNPENAKELIKGSVPKLKLLVNASEQSTKILQICNHFQEFMKHIGITIEIDRQEKAFYYEKLHKGDFDLAYVTWELGQSYDLQPIFHSKGFSNYGGYSNQEVDHLLDEAKTSIDTSVTFEKVRKAQELLREECPHIFLWALSYTAAFNNKIKGIDEETLNPFSIFDHSSQWWIPAKQRSR